MVRHIHAKLHLPVTLKPGPINAVLNQPVIHQQYAEGVAAPFSILMLVRFPRTIYITRTSHCSENLSRASGQLPFTNKRSGPHVAYQSHYNAQQALLATPPYVANLEPARL